MSPRRTEGQNKFASVWQGFCVAQYGQQVHPSQTKTVKGQNSWGIICIEKRRSPLFGFAAADKAYNLINFVSIQN